MGCLGGRSIGVLVEGMSWSMEDGEDGGSPHRPILLWAPEGLM